MKRQRYLVLLVASDGRPVVLSELVDVAASVGNGAVLKERPRLFSSDAEATDAAKKQLLGKRFGFHVIAWGTE